MLSHALRRSRATLTSPRALAGAGLLALILFPRLLGLGTVLTVDEPLWRARGNEFFLGLGSFNPAKTFTGGQPGVTTMWFAGLADRFHSLAASQAALALATSGLLVLALGLLSRLTSPAVALAGGTVAALDPFLIAHSRLVHTDALLGSFMLVALLALLLFWQTEARRYLVYAGVTTALAILTKLFGIFLLLPAAAVTLCAPHRPAVGAGAIRQTRRRVVRARLRRFLVPLLVVSFVAWPALLFSPRLPLAHMLERVTLHAQSAPVGSGGGDPWYYPREFVRRLTPTVTLLLPIAAVGLLAGGRNRSTAFPGRAVFGALLGVSALYVLALSLAEQKADRYVLVAHLVADFTAGATLVWLAALVTRKRPARRTLATAALTVIAASFLLRDVVRIHPHYLAQWNRLLPVPEGLKLGWGEGLEEAATYFRSLNAPFEDLRIASYYPGILSHFLPGARIEKLTRYTDAEFSHAVLYRSMYGRAADSYETAALQKFLGEHPQEGTRVTVDDTPFRLEKIVYINHLPYAWIFRRL